MRCVFQLIRFVRPLRREVGGEIPLIGPGAARPPIHRLVHRTAGGLTTGDGEISADLKAIMTAKAVVFGSLPCEATVEICRRTGKLPFCGEEHQNNG